MGNRLAKENTNSIVGKKVWNSGTTSVDSLLCTEQRAAVQDYFQHLTGDNSQNRHYTKHNKTGAEAPCSHTHAKGARLQHKAIKRATQKSKEKPQLNSIQET